MAGHTGAWMCSWLPELEQSVALSVVLCLVRPTAQRRVSVGTVPDENKHTTTRTHARTYSHSHSLTHAHTGPHTHGPHARHTQTAHTHTHTQRKHQADPRRADQDQRLCANAERRRRRRRLWRTGATTLMYTPARQRIRVGRCTAPPTAGAAVRRWAQCKSRSHCGGECRGLCKMPLCCPLHALRSVPSCIVAGGLSCVARWLSACCVATYCVAIDAAVRTVASGEVLQRLSHAAEEVDHP